MNTILLESFSIRIQDGNQQQKPHHNEKYQYKGDVFLLHSRAPRAPST